MKEYTRDNPIIFSNTFMYKDVKSRLWKFIWNAQKRSMVNNMEQIKNNATHFIRIMKEYTKDITVIVQTRSRI